MLTSLVILFRTRFSRSLYPWHCHYLSGAIRRPWPVQSRPRARALLYQTYRCAYQSDVRRCVQYLNSRPNSYTVECPESFETNVIWRFIGLAAAAGSVCAFIYRYIIYVYASVYVNEPFSRASIRLRHRRVTVTLILTDDKTSRRVLGTSIIICRVLWYCGTACVATKLEFPIRLQLPAARRDGSVGINSSRWAIYTCICIYVYIYKSLSSGQCWTRSRKKIWLNVNNPKVDADLILFTSITHTRLILTSKLRRRR